MLKSYIAPEYKEIEQALESFLQEQNLDIVTVRSLLRGSMEVFETELPKAMLVYINGSDLSKGASCKVKNIKVNFKFAIESIVNVKQICSEKELGLILTLLKALVFLIDRATIRLGNSEALVVFCLYRLQQATPEEIAEYAKKLKESNKKADMTFAEVETALGKLEEINTVELQNGKYVLCETIIVKVS